jgi:hypothetical protein
MSPPKYVVRVSGLNKDGKEEFGTGFLISDSGHVATCWHIVENLTDLHVQLPLSEPWKYQLLKAKPEEDVVILKGVVPPGVTLTTANVDLEWWRLSKVSDRVSIYGYSADNRFAGSQLYTHTISGFMARYGRIGLNGDVNSGDSGGPVVNDAGRVIGIAQAKDPKLSGQAAAIPIQLLPWESVSVEDIGSSAGILISGQQTGIQAEFLHSIITARQFANIGAIYNPYTEFFSDGSHDRKSVKVYLWMPQSSVFEHKEISDTPVVAICDAGILEVEKHVRMLDREFLHDCYKFSPSGLNNVKKRRLIDMIGRVLRGTFVLAAVVPKFLLAPGLQSPKATYRAILNVVLLPLVAAHKKFEFEHFNLALSGTGNCDKFVTSIGTTIVKSGFDGRFKLSKVDEASDEYFYIYAAQIISWSVTRNYREVLEEKKKDSEWVELLDKAFTQ